jgi:hypothetical protein
VRSKKRRKEKKKRKSINKRNNELKSISIKHKREADN